jgi:hypothetical protein
MQPLEIIHKILDDTYSPVSKSGTYSLKHSMHGNRLVLNYSTIVHFASEHALRPQVEVAKDQARQLIKEKVARLKKDYKDVAEESLKYDDAGEQDNIELIQSTSNSLRKVAYYRYSQTLDFSV